MAHTTWQPSITTGTHSDDGRTRLHPLLSNRKLVEGHGEYITRFDDVTLDDVAMSELRASAKAIGVELKWDDTGLYVRSIDWSSYPMRLQYPCEQSFIDAMNEIIGEICEQYETEDEDEGDHEQRFQLVCNESAIEMEMTESDIRAAIIEAAADVAI